MSLRFNLACALLAMHVMAAAAPITNGSFESGDYTGWTATGEAFGSGPLDYRSHPAIRNWEGRYYICTHAAGESKVGVLRSDTFTLHSSIFMLLSGWNHWPGQQSPEHHNYVVLRRAADDAELDRVWAPNHDFMAPRILATPSAIGQEVYLEIVDDGSDDAYAWLAVDLLVQAGASRPEGTFESGSFGAWSVLSGSAFGSGPVTSAENVHVSDYEGTRFVDTLHSGEAEIGVLRSPTFTLNGSVQFRIAGHNHWPGVESEFDHNYVVLRRAGDGAELDRVWAPGNNAFQPRRLSAPAATGAQVYIEVVDDGANTAYAWLAVDAFDIPAAGLTHDNEAGTWVATDELGRALPVSGEVGALRDDRFVGIFYFLWHSVHDNQGVWDVNAIQQQHPYDTATYPTVEAYLDELELHLGAWKHGHWWGRPVFDYYVGYDPYVLRKHLQMLGDAGVDTLILDATNGFTYIDHVRLVLAIAQQLRNEGCRTPQMTFLARETDDVMPNTAAEMLWRDIYQADYFPDLWFRWHGKPLILVFDADGNGVNLPQEFKDYFTVRESWAFSTWAWFGSGQHKWPWLDAYPQNWGWHEDSDVPEAMAVSIAQHPNSNIGRSYQYLAGGQPPFGFAPTEQGLYLSEQTLRPLTHDPEFIFFTGWNEWLAGRWKIGEDGFNEPITQMGVPRYNGDSAFIDGFDHEYSRDAEPVRGGHGDAYYYQMIDFIRRYKGVAAPEAASPPETTRDVDDFTGWDQIKPVYRDQRLDPAQRNEFVGYGSIAAGPYFGPYTNLTGRNDLIEARVTYDWFNCYFYVRTADPLTTHTGDNWMQLLLDTDSSASTGWKGYDYIVNRVRPTAERATLESNVGNAWSWTAVGEVNYAVSGDAMQIAVPRQMIGLGDPPFQVDFKWVDGVDIAGDITKLTTDGDCAPNDRFNYRYAASRPVPTAVTWWPLMH